MKNSSIVCLFLALSLWGCKSKDNANSADSKNSKEESQHLTTAPPDVIASGKQEVLTAGKPKAMGMGKPIVIATNINVHSSVVSTQPLMGNPAVLTPGSANYSLPKNISSTGEPFVCKQPLPVNSLSMRTKDIANCNVQFMDIEMGLNGNNINTICEDKNGMIWLGTRMGGLSKYDGKSFLHYTTKEGFINNNVHVIAEDSYGNIWIGTDAGVCKYDGKTFVKFTENDGLCNNSILSILIDKNNSVWFGTANGVSKYDGESFTNFTDKEGMSNRVSCMAEDKNGNIWFGTYNEGLYKYNEKNFTHYTKQEGLLSNAIYNLLVDNDGNLWLGTDKGLCKFDFNSFATFSYNTGLVVCSVKDASGNLWFGSTENGIIKREGNNFVNYTEKEGLSNNNINALIEDQSGNLWLGTDGGGLNKFATKSFTHFEDKELLETGNMPIAQDKAGNIWIGTNGDNISFYDEKSFTIYNKLFTSSNKLSAPTLCIYKDHTNGNLWFGTKGGGLYSFDGKSLLNYTRTEGLNDDYIYSITQDRNGNLWVGTNNGAAKFDGTSFTHFTEKEGLINNKVLSVLEDNSKNIWFGTSEGLSKYDGKSFENYTTKQGLINNKVFSMLEDKGGNIWCATDSGLCNYNPSFATGGSNPFTNYSEKNGLSSNSVSSIVMDKTGNLWITTNKGLDIITKEELESTVGLPAIINLTKKDGLKQNVFNKNSAFIDSKGRAWWGSAKAITLLDLNNFSFPKQSPKIQLTSIDLEQKFIDFNLLKDTLAKGGNISIGLDKNKKSLNEVRFDEVKSYFNYPLNLKLPDYLNYLTFHFSATDWQAPHKIVYEYMLQPLDKEWSAETQMNTADYRNIPSGHYIFRVQAKGISNKWSEPIEYSFDIIYPWWSLWYVRALGACAIGVIIWLFFRWRTSSLIKRQKELEQIVMERTAEVVNEKKEVEKQKEVVEQKNKEITDSIEYALRIQSAILPAARTVKQYLENTFILYKPKDIVAGDFYWMETINSKSGGQSKEETTILFAACDCTGHGVPGAMVSVVCHNALNRAVREFGLTHPAAILDKTAEIVIDNFSKSEEEIKDGMDISLVSIRYTANSNEVLIEWAGANNPIWLFKDNVLEETKADKQPIGMYEDNHPFTNHQFTLKKGDTIYIFTDGFADQFGGDTGGKKLTRKRFKDLLMNLQSKPMELQGTMLDSFILDYRKDVEQIDDILVMGVRL